MQPVRVYKVFLAFYSKSKCWALRASCILRAGFFLGRNRVGKYRGPRGHTLVKERLQKRLSSWKGKLLSLGGRLILINSVLSNMVLYMISFFLLPKGVLHKLDYYRSRFFWQGDSEKKKYRLAKWSVLCSPKD
jgi:hypothetical protein